MILGSKTAAFIAILTLVDSPTDKLIYCAIMVGSNAAISLCTFFYHRTSIPLSIPTRRELSTFVLRAVPINLGLVASGFLDRLDLLLVKKIYTDVEAGIYAVPLKLAQSILPLFVSVSRVFFSEMLTEDADPGLVTRLVRLEALLAFSGLFAVGFGGLWTGDFVLSLLFKSQDPLNGPLLLLLSLSAVSSYAIYMFGYQVLWRAGIYHKVTGLIFASVLLAIGLGFTLSHSYGILGIPAAIFGSKAIAAIILAWWAKSHLRRLPLKEIVLSLIIALVMAGVVSMIPNPFAAIIAGAATFTMLQGLYYALDRDHPLRS